MKCMRGNLNFLSWHLNHCVGGDNDDNLHLNCGSTFSLSFPSSVTRHRLCIAGLAWGSKVVLGARKVSSFRGRQGKFLDSLWGWNSGWMTVSKLHSNLLRQAACQTARGFGRNVSIVLPEHWRSNFGISKYGILKRIDFSHQVTETRSLKHCWHYFVVLLKRNVNRWDNIHSSL